MSSNKKKPAEILIRVCLYCTGGIPASPHFSAVDYRISDSDAATHQEMEVLRRELMNLRSRLEKLSSKQKQASASKGKQLTTMLMMCLNLLLYMKITFGYALYSSSHWTE